MVVILFLAAGARDGVERVSEEGDAVSASLKDIPGLEPRIDLTSPELRTAHNMALEDAAKMCEAMSKNLPPVQTGVWQLAANACRALKVSDPAFAGIRDSSRLIWPPYRGDIIDDGPDGEWT